MFFLGASFVMLYWFATSCLLKRRFCQITFHKTLSLLLIYSAGYFISISEQNLH
jgi:hypothetical protein